MRYAIVLAEEPHRQVFAEVVQALLWCLFELGHSVEERTDVSPDPSVRHIVLAPHLLLASDENVRVPPGTIVWNFEPACSPLFYRSLHLMTQAGVTVWDYADGTTKKLRAMGLPVFHVPLLFCPSMLRHWRSLLPELGIEKRYDVLFVGSISPRRARVLEELRAAGLSVRIAFGVYGPERDALLAHTRVLLNVHYWTESPNEDTRLTYACANGVAVASEGPPDDPRKLGWARYAPYDQLVEETRRVVESGDWALQGPDGQRALLAGRSMVTAIREALS